MKTLIFMCAKVSIWNFVQGTRRFSEAGIEDERAL